jgi:integrase
MQGHVRKRTHKTKDGRVTVNWYVVIELARDSTGKRRQKWYGSYRTRKEAEAARIEILHQINTGTWIEPTSQTFGEWVHETWLPLATQRLKPSAEAHYRNYLRLHILPTLGSLQFRQITPTVLNQLYTHLLTAGNRKTGGALSPKTVTNVHAIIHKALEDAVDLGLVNVNMADRAKPPRPKAKKPKEIKSWTPEELHRFLDLIEGHRLEAAYYLKAFTGMRRAEILGLRWQDLDLDASRLAVRQTVTAVGYKIVKGSPKTHQARTIDLDPITVEKLHQHRERQAEDRREWGNDYRGEDLVFAREDGSPVHPHSFSQTFERVVARSGLRIIPLHGLRHTHATVGLSLGVPAKVISERLGHEDVAFTLKQYAHVLPGMQADAARRIASAVMDDEEEDDDQEEEPDLVDENQENEEESGSK